MCHECHKHVFHFLGTMTIGLLAGVLGVAIFGGLACVAIYATGPNVNNGLLIFYSGFAAFLIGVLASKGDSEQKVLSPLITSIPFIGRNFFLHHFSSPSKST